MLRKNIVLVDKDATCNGRDFKQYVSLSNTRKQHTTPSLDALLLGLVSTFLKILETHELLTSILRKKDSIQYDLDSCIGC